MTIEYDTETLRDIYSGDTTESRRVRALCDELDRTRAERDAAVADRNAMLAVLDAEIAP